MVARKFILNSVKLEALRLAKERRDGASLSLFLSRRSLKSFVSFLSAFTGTGVYVSELMIVGVGFKFLGFDKRVLQLSLGYSHDVYMFIESGLDYHIFKQYLALFSYSRVLATQTASRVRGLRVPDSYKGKGIRYLGEAVQIKKGKQKQR